MVATKTTGRNLQKLIDLRCCPTEQYIRDRFKKDIFWKQEKTRLSRACSIEDDDLIERMLKRGIRAENVPALQMFPIAMAAWASGSVSSQEAQAALQSVFPFELSGHAASVNLFRSWLEEKPDADLWQIWEDFVSARMQQIDLRHTQKIGRTIYKMAERVSLASGGFWGLGSVCREEQELLERIKQTFQLDQT